MIYPGEEEEEDEGNDHMMGRKESIMFNYNHRESVVNPFAPQGSFVMDPY